MNPNLKLCYIDGAWAYFTTQALADQIGDDWNDAPYECNAGAPYGWGEHVGDHDLIGHDVGNANHLRRPHQPRRNQCASSPVIDRLGRIAAPGGGG